jgi:Trk-type K+ transport system membrane component
LLSNNLYEESIRFNYNLQLAISWLIITGGIGYSVMINHWAIFKNIVSKVMQPLTGPRPNVLVRTSINTRIIAFTTFILLFAGTGLFFVSEYNNTLAEHSLWGKFVVSFFNATTPRTAGFNNINMAELGIPAFMLIMALMWVGASPGSTGGGIKTTTFAVALLNLWNQIKGRERLIIRLKEIPGSTINQVNAVILLSIFAISFGTFLLAFLEKDILFKDLLFESISAFSTVGLSIGITPALTEGSQYVLIGLMFLGRVSFLTFLIGLFNNLDSGDPACSAYYGKENVIIN